MLKLATVVEQRERLLEHLEGCEHCWETIEPLLAKDTLLSGVSFSGESVEPELFGDLMAILNATPTDDDEYENTLLETDSETVRTTIGHYRIERLLGRGGMGIVFLAVDTRLHRNVALKVMRPKFAACSAARGRFLREARAAARISHDNVVTVYEADEREGTPFIAMQFLEGSALEGQLRENVQHPVSEVIRIAKETAAALAAAHAIDLVHRDIKPGNLWIEAISGRVKVLDFGIAKPLDAEIELTKLGGIVGTPAYMSPEQARGKVLDGRSDLFSLGVVLYRLCTGKLPFDGPNTMAVLMALGTEEPTWVPDLNPEVPGALAKLIHQLLAKNPNDRPSSAIDVANRLEAMGKPSLKKPGIRGVWIASGFAAFAAILLIGAFIIIKTKDGKETRIEVPDGATIAVHDKDGKPLAVVTDLEDAAWEKEVAAMKPEQQTLAVTARLKQKNPKLDERSIFYSIEKGAVVSLEVRNASELADVTPIRALKDLTVLTFDGGFRNPCDISPLKGMKFTELHFNGCPIKDVSPLKGMPLKKCYFWGAMTTDLSPLAGMKLVRTNIGHSNQKDLTVFRGMPLEFICANHSRVDDLASLKDCPLTVLEISHTKITDLSPLKGKSIELLAIDGTPIKDVSVLKTLALKTLFIDDPISHREVLLAIPTLKTINGRPAAEVLGERKNGSVAEWVISLGGEIIVAGRDQPVGRNDDLPKTPFTIAGVRFFGNRNIRDEGLARLAELPELNVLILYNTSIADDGMIHVGKLTKLTRLDLGHTKVTDTGLDRIRGLKALRHLFVHYTGVTDAWLANLKGFPELVELNLNGAVTDEGLVHLVGCKKLNVLSMEHANVTDAGLEVIAKVPRLTSINVKSTKVTAQGLTKFHAARPGVKIDHNGGTIEAEK